MNKRLELEFCSSHGAYETVYSSCPICYAIKLYTGIIDGLATELRDLRKVSYQNKLVKELPGYVTCQFCNRIFHKSDKEGHALDCSWDTAKE